MNVLDHIKEEHNGFKLKIAKIEVAKGDRKKEIFRELYSEIDGHHEAEEKVVFSLVKQKADKEAMEVVLEMIEEHKLASYQFSVLEKTSIENETWDAKFCVLKEVLEHHIKEEEEELLPVAKKLILNETLVVVLEQFEAILEKKMKERKKKLG